MSENSSGTPTPADFFSWLAQAMQAAGAGAYAPNIPPNTDPIAAWRSFAEKNQEAFSKFWQQALSSTTSAQGIPRSAEISSNYRNLIKQAAKAYLDAADMPSRNDVIQLGEQLAVLHGRLEDLNENFEDKLSAFSDTLTRLTLVMDNMATRLERLEGHFKQLEDQS
jgi:hypothetical protein